MKHNCLTVLLDKLNVHTQHHTQQLQQQVEYVPIIMNRDNLNIINTHTQHHITQQ